MYYGVEMEGTKSGAARAALPPRLRWPWHVRGNNVQKEELYRYIIAKEFECKFAHLSVVPHQGGSRG